MNQTTKPAACPDSVRTERIQILHGRAIRVVSVFPKNGSQTVEEKLRVLAALELQRKKVGIRARLLAPLGVLCAHNALSGLTQRRKDKCQTRRKPPSTAGSVRTTA